MEEDYSTSIKQLWEATPDQAPLDTKISMMSTSLFKWARTRVSNLAKDIREVKTNLNKILSDEDRPYNADEINKREISLGVLHHGESLIHRNPTNITLIPKTKDPDSMKDYCLISLCNITYKVIAQAMNNRLKSILGNIIDPH